MRIGILGGAFDPLHTEHIKIIERSLDVLNLERVIIVPSFNPPHKHCKITPFEDRVKMLESYFRGNSRVIIDTIEKELALANSYSYVIIKELKKKYQGELFYIIGGDSMIKFKTWVHPEIISKDINLAVFKRKGYVGLEDAIEHAKLNYGAKIYDFDIDLREVSSSECKAILELNLDDKCDIIPEEVENYAKTHGLYNQFAEIVDKLKNSITPKLFNHCARTAIYAVRHANTCDVKFEDAFIAGLLHDCAKGLPQINSYQDVPQPVIHQFEGEIRARTEYNIENESVLRAIKYHTTGYEHIDNLGKLIYCADKLEDGRNYDGIDALRSEVEKGIDRGYKAVLEHGINYLTSQGIEPDVLTKKAFDAIIN